MKIDLHEFDTSPIEAFADKYNLIMDVWKNDECYVAKFENVLIEEAKMWDFHIIDFTDAGMGGKTISEAIVHYAMAITTEMILYRTDDEIGTIHVPDLQPYKPDPNKTDND